MPPRIAPFAFRHNVTAGLRLQVSCSLEQGDLPVKFEWLKDSKPLPSNRGFSSSHTKSLNIKIFQLDEYSSVLVIPRVTAHHSGNYTCFAVNNVYKSEFTAPLTVNGNSSLSTFMH